MGEEHRPSGVSIEFAVASTWLLRLGIVILVMAVGFFLKYSMEHDYIGPLGRVGISILVGIAMLGILGGYRTPVMLSTGAVNFVGLFSYTLLLGVGVLGISYKKNWHLLNYFIWSIAPSRRCWMPSDC